jgi:predicted TIM-barrel fold metal-dependent hydrolase
MIYEGGAVDIWCSPFTPPLMQKIFRDAPELAEEIDRYNLHENVRGWSVPEFIAIMNEANVLMAGIPAYQIWSFERREQLVDIRPEEVADLVRQAPDRLYGYYGINPYKRMAGVRELDWAIRELGFKGAHLLVYGFDLPINHRDLYPYYAKCVELDVPVVIQVCHCAQTMPSAHARPILLDDIALYFPTLKIVGGHTGWPWTSELIAMAWKHKNVYLSASGFAPRMWSPELDTFINFQGRGKCMWGADLPILTYAASERQLAQKQFREDARRLLFRDTADAVFKLGLAERLATEAKV